MTTFTITIHDEADEAEVGLLSDVLSKIAGYQHVKIANVYVRGREPSGWCEYINVMDFDTGGKLTVGCLQRTRGAFTEFHT